jgi:N-acetyl-anhydromuramyl-L-alanine amidase AmpD
MTAWRNQYVHVNQYTRPGKKLNGVRKLIVHYTANPGATAANHFGYFDKSAPAAKRFASAHIFVDKTEAICIIPLDEVAYAAGDVQQRDKNGNPYRGVPALLPSANYLSISVELCIEKDGTFHADTIARAVDVFAELCATYKLDPSTDIVRHYDVTHKNCPAPWVADSSKFVEFKCKVSAKMGAQPTPVAPAPPTSSILREGDSGAEVKELQSDLTCVGYPCGTIDGDFGPKTKTALIKFQGDNGLTADGIYGPNTKAKLDAVLAKKKEPTPVAPAPTPSAPKVIQQVRAKVVNDIRALPDHKSAFVRNAKVGEVFDVYARSGDWHKVADGWIDGNGGKNLYWIR